MVFVKRKKLLASSFLNQPVLSKSRFFRNSELACWSHLYIYAHSPLNLSCDTHVTYVRKKTSVDIKLALSFDLAMNNMIVALPTHVYAYRATWNAAGLLV